MGMYCTAVVLAAGRGSRMGTAVAKQYLSLGGRPLVALALQAFEDSPLVDEIVLMTDAGHVEYGRSLAEKYGFHKVSAVEAGGTERYESVWKALQVIESGRGGTERAARRRAGCVLIHDGARPFVSGEIIRRVREAAEAYGACVAGMPVKDTIKLVGSDGCIEASPDRSRVWQAQTPQGFSVPLIVRAFESQLREDCGMITDDAMVVERQTGVRVRMVEGSYENIKITTPEDLQIAESFLHGAQ